VGQKIPRVMVLTSLLIMMTTTIPLGFAYEWSPDMRLTWDGESDLNPSIVEASDGKIWVVWQSFRTGNFDLFYKVYDSSKVHPWSSETRLTTDSNADRSGSIMQAKDGKIWVVWSTNRDGNYEIYYKTSSDNGATWSWPEKNLTRNQKDSECPSIMQTANGTIWLAWSANRTGNYEIYYKTSSDNGATWSPDMSLPYAAADDRDPSITQTADGKIWVVWVRNDIENYNIKYKTYDPTLKSWSGTYSVTQDLGIFNSNPSIMQAKDDQIWFVWDSERGDEQTDIYYRIQGGPMPTRLTYYQLDDFAPSIMQAADGTIWIAWASWRAENFDIYYRTTKIPQPHDVAVFDVIPSEVTVTIGQTVSIEVVAQNHGTNYENFKIRCYADLTLINESETIGLSPGQLYHITFTWNALNTGTYKIWAKASIVNGEIYAVDNAFPAIVGDVNDDRTVNASDVSVLSNAYGSKPGDSNWNPNCNFDGFDGDNKVDACDLFDLGKNYGRSQ